jgi:hypothetical protein
MLSLGFYLLPANQMIGPAQVSEGIQGHIEGVYDNPVVRDQLNQLPPALRAQVKTDLANSVESYVQRFLGPLGRLLPPLLAFGLFLVLWSVLFIYRELAIWCGALLFWILTTTGFVRVVEKDVKAQALEL